MLVVKLAPVWVCFLLCFLLAWIAARRNHIARDWRLYWIFAALANGFFQVLIAEVAGAFHSLDRATVAAAWMEVDAALACLIGWKFRGDILELSLGKRLVEAREAFHGQPGAARLIWALGLAFALFLGCVSLQAPTFEWDCQVYHLPRIMHWLQDKSLRHYACRALWQVCYAPAAEIASATLYLLDGSDRPVNLPSWFALVTCAFLGSFVTETLAKLHAQRTARPWPEAKVALAAAFGFLLVLTLPTGDWEAMTTMNDTVVATWNLSLACLTLLFLRQPANLFYAAGMGVSLALGICTKATMFISAPPFLAGAFGLLAWRRFYREALQLAAILALTVLLVNGPWFLRNYRVFGHPLGTTAISTMAVNGAFSPARGLANILRNLSVYARTPSATVTKTLNDIVYALVFCTGRPLDDPSSIFQYPSVHFTFQAPAAIGKGDMGFYPHAWLLAAALLVVLASFPLRNAVGFHLAATCLGFCLFCFYLRWQGLSRLDLTYFALAMPVVAVGLAAVARRALIVVLAFLCLANAACVVLYNSEFPINTQARLQDKPREEQMLSGSPSFYGESVALAEDIVERDCTNVLLKCGSFTPEYTLWVCLQNRAFHGTIEHILVDNETAALSRCNVNDRTAIVFSTGHPPNTFAFAASPRGRTYPLLAVTYDSGGDFGGISALFPSPHPDRWVRLLSPGNEATQHLTLPGTEGIGVGKPILVHLSCKTADRHGLAVTNNVLRIAIGGSAGEIDLRAGFVAATALATESPVTVKISLLRPVPPGQGPIYLSYLNATWEWAKNQARGTP